MAGVAPDMVALTRLDAAASAALSVVGKDATSQLAVLACLRALADALPDDGISRGLVVTSLQERQEAFVAFHERQLAHNGTTGGSAAAWDEAIAFTLGVSGEGPEVATLRARKAAAVAGGPPPRPFFARFLEHQRR